jgi:hypothetical protein
MTRHKPKGPLEKGQKNLVDAFHWAKHEISGAGLDLAAAWVAYSVFPHWWGREGGLLGWLTGLVAVGCLARALNTLMIEVPARVATVRERIKAAKESKREKARETAVDTGLRLSDPLPHSVGQFAIVGAALVSTAGCLPSFAAGDMHLQALSASFVLMYAGTLYRAGMARAQARYDKAWAKMKL